MLAHTQARSCSTVIVFILDEERKSCLTCGNPETNAHFIHRSYNDPPTSLVNRCSSTRDSSIVSSVRSHRVTNWSYALNVSVAYAVIMARLICSASAFCFLPNCLHTVRAQHHSHNSRTHSILSIAHSSQINSRFSIHSTIGKSVATPLNTGIR